MKKNILTLILVAVLLAACNTPVTPAEENRPTDAIVAPDVEESTETQAAAEELAAADVTQVDEDVNTDIQEVNPMETPAQITVGGLSADETAGISFMREEEKLARDVYLTLYEQWGLPIFQNIANSEAAHMEVVKTLIDRYSLEDPAAGNDIGQFSNATLQGLYDQLVAQGSQSRSEAIKVGAAIEEIDILDLEEYIAQTDKPDIQQVYQNLMRGSRNHLRSFVQMFEKQTGETYQPQYLSQEAYDAIVNSDMETGGQGGG